MAHERARADGALAFQIGLDDLDQGLSVFDADRCLVVWNRRFVELLDLPPSLARRGASYAEIVRYLAARGELGPGDVDDIIAQRMHAADHSARFYSERTTLAGRILAAHTHPVATGGFVTVYSDVTERGAAEARVNQRIVELRAVNDKLRDSVRRLEMISAAHAQSEARLRLITDAIPAAIAYIDADLRLQFANRRFARLFDMTREEAIGQSMPGVFGGALVPALSEHLAVALAGQSASFEHGFRAPSGRDVITRNTLIPELGDGRVLGIFVLSLDITEEKRAERGLREAQKISAIGQLAGGLAHDFNNLLTVIVGNLCSLRERVDPDLGRELVEPAVRASYRGSDITRRLLAFARLQSLAPSPIDVAGLVAGTAQLLRRSLPSTIAIQCSAEPDGWLALADAAQLENALVNLALNARDAMPHGGTLSFATANARIDDAAALPVGDYVSIRVGDTGTGIAPEIQGRILEPFFTTKPFGSGSGLGLSMVFGFVRQSGGDLRIASEVGRGTSVTLLLPRAVGATVGATVVDTAIERGPAVAGRGELVLLAEDHDDVRHAVRRHLVELGFQVLEACDGDDARSLLAAVPEVAVLVSDVVMPGTIDGLGLADHARRVIPGIRIVLISGFANFAADGYDWFDERLVLRKPFGKDDLSRVLHGTHE
jgi:PAS domain S-box-containing protein